MKFHFALLGVLCALALARDENNKWLKATAKSTGATRNERLKGRMTKRDFFVSHTPKSIKLPDDSAVVVRTTPPSQSNGASIMSRCSSGTIDEITVRVQGIHSRNGVEYVYLPMGEDSQKSCFDDYNNTVLVASDLTSCCDAAAQRKFNSFRFDGGVCTGFTAWLSPIHTECAVDWDISNGLFVAKKKLSNFAPPVPTFASNFSLGMASISVELTNMSVGCRFAKTIKVTIYSKTVTQKLEMVEDDFHFKRYLPELCDDNASADKRTATVSILDWDGSVLASVTRVSSSELTGRHLLANGVCVMYTDATQRVYNVAHSYCANDTLSLLPFDDGFFPLASLVREVAGLNANVGSFWTDAVFITYTKRWIWEASGILIDMNLFKMDSLTSNIPRGPVILNVTDGLLHEVTRTSQSSTVCVDVPYR